MNYQHTLAHRISCSGIGLHSGRAAELTLCPAKPGTGVVFKRLDVPAGEALVLARYDQVAETRLGTTIRNIYGTGVSTIEHLMAALWGAGVDNAIIELSGPEVPIMDGSSEPFMFMIECAGLVKQQAPRLSLRVLKTVEVREGNSVARVSPNGEGDEGCVMHIEIEYDGSIITKQSATYDFRDMTFKQSLARARTFGFEHEVNALRKMGLALGGSLENAIVVGKDGILNEEGLRFGDEFLRHKALDCVGDLFLAGYPIDGRFDFVRPGHGINNRLLRALFADPSAYCISSSEPADLTAIPAAQNRLPAYA